MSRNFRLDYLIDKEVLSEKIFNICKLYRSTKESTLITNLIIRGEEMFVSTHGLHYFVHSIYPHLKKGETFFEVKEESNFIISNGEGGIGFRNLSDCLKLASKNSLTDGVSIILCKNPGKIGALRVYCPELVEDGKLVFIFKNTASTQGLKGSVKPLVGTNPICIAFPDSDFIFDSSTSTVATNSVRLMSKQGQKFDFDLGINNSGNPTNNPDEILEEGSFLSTFSEGPLWFKSFYLGLAVELLSALAGGKTGKRVGKNKGRRLFSKEGLFAIVIDKSFFPEYASYLSEMKMLREELANAGHRFPGKFDTSVKQFHVSKKDWNFLDSL